MLFKKYLIQGWILYKLGTFIKNCGKKIRHFFKPKPKLLSICQNKVIMAKAALEVGYCKNIAEIRWERTPN
jgi:hypothetical protein